MELARAVQPQPADRGVFVLGGVLVVLGFAACLIIAIARPQAVSNRQDVTTEGIDIVLVLGLIYHLEDPIGALRLARALTPIDWQSACWGCSKTPAPFPG